MQQSLAELSAIVPLELGEHSHEIRIQFGSRLTLAESLAHLNNGQQFVVISQREILEHYQAVVNELEQSGFKLTVIVVPSDESAKDIREAEKVWAAMVSAGCDRSSIVIALGGGVVGDLSGFVASTYMRGIRFVQVPTTLLAMVDSAIGGKTAVNLQAGKNLVGAIHQPSLIQIDPEFLGTLPRRNVISSLAEAVKYGLIRDPAIFEVFESQYDSLVSLEDKALLSEIITASCRIKAQIVSNDQFEGGERKLLNFGHTIGHALETISAYQGLYHGEAVLYGMRCAAYISQTKGLISDQDYQRIKNTLAQFELPNLPEIHSEQVLEIVSHDKKKVGNTLSFILIDDIGNGIIRSDVTNDEISDSLELLSSTS